MAMDEKKMIEKLDESTKDIAVPKKLLPENIMNTINDSKKGKKVIHFESLRRSGVTKKLAGVVSAAAVLIVVAVAVYQLPAGDKSAENAMRFMDATEAAGESMVIAQTGNVSSYDEVYKEFEKHKTPQPSWFERIFYGREEKYMLTEDAVYNGALEMETQAAGTVAENMSLWNEAGESADAAAGAGYSKTNVQTVGIDEADIIKTDGQYIYYASSNLHTVTIYRVNGEETEAVKNLYVEEVGGLSEIYVDGDMLLAVGDSYRNEKYQIVLAKYDITDRKNPKLVGTFSQEGNRIETRKTGDIVYVVTEVRRNADNIKKNVPETFIPSVCDKLLEPIDIFIPDETQGTTYTVISSVDIKGDLKQIDSAAVLGFNGTFYMGNESMYLYRTRYATSESGEFAYSSGERFTEIRRIDYVKENGLIGAITEGKVPGVVKDTFAINEYQGYLRIMTTSYPGYSNNESVNNVFVLNQELDIVGSIEGLAKGERIYSARYMGDTAYFVTYRETDPLYSVDLSNPESPKIMGALKIPGFSEYLHAYGDNLLLGIGIEQIPDKDGWNTDYIKLSMFDTTNPYDVTEKNKMILNDANDSMALYEYKAVMIDPQKNLFGFVTESYGNRTNGTLNKDCYRVFTYTDSGFVELVTHEVEKGDVYGTRSVYIGDYVYIVNENGVTVYSIAER